MEKKKTGPGKTKKPGAASLQRGPEIWWKQPHAPAPEPQSEEPDAPGSSDAEGTLGRRMRQPEGPRRVPHRALWKRLYELAGQVKQLAPWEWMSEIDVFGVRLPSTREPVFVSVMGQLGKHLAVGVYPGALAMAEFHDVATGEAEAAHLLLEVPQVQLSFEDRDFVEREDRTVMKGLNLSGRYRGEQAYPLFRSFRPGYAPWFIEADEGEALAWALEQLLDVAPRFRDGELALGMAEDEPILVRAPRLDGQGIQWLDCREEMEWPEAPPVPYVVDRDQLAQVGNLLRPMRQKNLTYY